MTNNHPLLLNAEAIEREGIMVLDDVRSMPVYGEAFISPYLIVALNIQGWVKAELDMRPVLFERHDLAIVHPDHSLCAYQSSDDYLAMMIVVAPKVIAEMKGKLPSLFVQMNHYVHHPDVKLTNSQFGDVYNQMRLMRNLGRQGGPNHKLILSGLLQAFFLILKDYSLLANGEMQLSPREVLFDRFYEALVTHYRESREVSFYANLLCMSPKHFAAVIKQLTGINAHDWISNYVALRAKTLLERPGMTVQQAAELLGFVDQATFSRFYKMRTGRSPSEGRRG
ncbi:MAG: helix-turn-helix domain-containing protein [Bacteroidales bacterium]|nr:helix-turn-helix domain-containing protein [Bacteroidales bacterium]